MEIVTAGDSSSAASEVLALPPADLRPSDFSDARITEFLGFTPLSFVDDVINSINRYIYKASQALQTFIEEQRPDLDQETVEKGVERFDLVMESAVDRNFDLFELFVLKNIFVLPAQASLPHHEGLDFDLAAQDSGRLDARLSEMISRIKETNAATIRLKAEKSMLQRQIRVAKEYLDLLNSFTQRLERAKAANDIHSESLASFITSMIDQLQAFETLMSSTLSDSQHKVDYGLTVMPPCPPSIVADIRKLQKTVRLRTDLNIDGFRELVS